MAVPKPTLQAIWIAQPWRFGKPNHDHVMVPPVQAISGQDGDLRPPLMVQADKMNGFYQLVDHRLIYIW